jgi:virginiamycin B lyase
MSHFSSHLWRVLVVSFLTLIVAAGSSVAQTIQEYPIPGGVLSAPVGITTGPDGAVWFAAGANIGQLTTSGALTEYPTPIALTFPQGIAAGADGALWFTNGISGIGRVTTTGSFTAFMVPTSTARTAGITAGPDGALWFTEPGAGKIGRITTSGAVTEFPTLISGSAPLSIAAGPDGALWFTDHGTGAIGKVTISGAITEFPLTAAGSRYDIKAGPDGALWFTGPLQAIGRITTAGQINQLSLPSSTNAPGGIAAGPDGVLWFTDIGTNSIGRITTGGVVTETPIPTSNSLAANFTAAITNQITAGPDGALWFAESAAGQIGRLSLGATSGPSPLVAAVLPSSRSVEVGNTATAFATIINSGLSAATSCGIAPVTPVPASFVYQTTNPATNALTGTPNTPVLIAAGGSQSFVIALTPNAPVVPTEVALGFACPGINAAPTTTGLDTLLYSASATPVPDIVALAATAQNDGILHIIGTSGSNAFAVATVNVGASAQITATANTGTASLPLTIDLCETDPQSGQCTSAIAPSATLTINADATPTVAIFATAAGGVPFVPQTNRIFVEFSDATGTVRGSTSVAVETQ